MLAEVEAIISGLEWFLCGSSETVAVNFIKTFLSFQIGAKGEKHTQKGESLFYYNTKWYIKMQRNDSQSLLCNAVFLTDEIPRKEMSLLRDKLRKFVDEMTTFFHFIFFNSCAICCEFRLLYINILVDC